MLQLIIPDIPIEPRALNLADRESLREFLADRRNTIAKQWSRTLAETGPATIGIRVLNQRLEILVDRCISLLLDQQFDHAGAEAIGVTLTDWHFIQPEVLGATQGLLLQAFTADLPAEYVVMLLPNLTALIQALAIGFTRQTQRRIIAEQERIHAALLAERKSVMEALHISTERLHAVVSNLPIIVFSIDREYDVTLAIGRGLKNVGGDAGKIIGQSIFDIARKYPQFLTGVRRALAGEAFTDNLEINDTIFEIRYTPLRTREGQVKALIGVALDITERQQMELELKEARYLISESREDERRQLARDLHDGVVQQLLGMNYQLAHIQQRISTSLQADSRFIEEILATQTTVQQGLLDVVGQLRHSISELRPAGLDDLGLTPALQTLIAQLEREAGPAVPVIEHDLDWIGTELPAPLARCFFRVAQEALRNALRHAEANYIAVMLRIYDETAILRIIDDGVGFEMPAHIMEFVRSQHFGLAGLLEQVEYLNGTFSVYSKPGEGSEVIVELPLGTELCRTNEVGCS